eukprot:g17625.t1
MSNNDHIEYIKEIECLTACCEDNNISLNVSKMKELVIDFREQGGAHTPFCINDVEGGSVKFLRGIVTNNLSLSAHVGTTVKKAQK